MLCGTFLWRRLGLTEFPDPTRPPVQFRDKYGVLLALGYTRVLYGDHGAYIEHTPEQLVASGWRKEEVRKGEYYDMMRTASEEGGWLVG